MSSASLVSIVVPVYNVEKYVEKCLTSLRGQSYENIEIIVVDDGSTDGSAMICDKFAKEDDRIKVFHKKNGGLSSARNYGIKRTKGEYVCLVDSDDWVKKNFVKAMVGEAMRAEADVVVCGFNGELPKAKTMSGKEATVRLLTRQDNMEIVAWNKMYRRRLFDNIEYPEGQNYEDTLTTYKLLGEAKAVAYVNKSLYMYAERNGSITRSDEKVKKLEVREQAAREAMRYFERNRDLYEAAEIALLLAKYAFLDFAIAGKVDKKFGCESMRWLKQNVKKYGNNNYLTGKLKIYNMMSTRCGGVCYTLFRKMRHE